MSRESRAARRVLITMARELESIAETMWSGTIMERWRLGECVRRTMCSIKENTHRRVNSYESRSDSLLRPICLASIIPRGRG